jgi:transcription elongation GreA/GreB family factor
MKLNHANIKAEVYNQCKKKLEERILNFETAMKNAQESSNSEDKSSAGDKYETSRAMGQLDRNMNAKQLVESQNEYASFIKINIEIKSEHIISGSMVETNNGIYFIAAGVGIIEISSLLKVIVLSPKSPLAIAMLGKKSGDKFLFNQKDFQINAIK